MARTDSPKRTSAAGRGRDANPAPSAVERVYQRTRTAILVGDYPPGMPLRMSDLAERNGVSTIPVREALRRLETERLVESVVNKGVRVAELSMEDLADAYQMRTILEVEAVRLAVPKLTPADRVKLEALLDEMSRHHAEGRLEAMHDTHRTLHFTVYERVGSPWLEHVIGALWDHTERYRRIASQWLYVSDDLGEQHRDVVAALFCGDVEQAVQALRDHFEAAQRYLHNRLEPKDEEQAGSAG
jgi:DNA-binding GntR family transcriptional regulator